MSRRILLWSDEGRVKGPTHRRIELVVGTDGKPAGYEIVVCWDGVPIRRIPSKKRPSAPNRWGKFILDRHPTAEAYRQFDDETPLPF